MHKNSPFWDPKSKNFLGMALPPPHTPPPSGRGKPPPHIPLPSAPTAPRSMVPPMLNRNRRPWYGDDHERGNSEAILYGLLADDDDDEYDYIRLMCNWHGQLAETKQQCKHNALHALSVKKTEIIHDRLLENRHIASKWRRILWPAGIAMLLPWGQKQKSWTRSRDTMSRSWSSQKVKTFIVYI